MNMKTMIIKQTIAVQRRKTIRRVVIISVSYWNIIESIAQITAFGQMNRVE